MFCCTCVYRRRYDKSCIIYHAWYSVRGLSRGQFLFLGDDTLSYRKFGNIHGNTVFFSRYIFDAYRIASVLPPISFPASRTTRDTADRAVIFLFWATGWNYHVGQSACYTNFTMYKMLLLCLVQTSEPNQFTPHNSGRSFTDHTYHLQITIYL